MRHLAVLAGLAFLAVASCTGSAEAPGEHAHTGQETFGDVTHAELLKIIDDGSAVILDVNSNASYQKGHVTGALHFPSVKDRLAEVLPEDKDTLVVAYCGGPKCGAWKRAAEAAAALGYTNVKHYSLGIMGWRERVDGQGA